MVSFSQLPAVKKDIIFGAARKFFGHSYFVTDMHMSMKGIHTIHMYVIKVCGPKKETNFKNGQKYGLM